MKKGGQHNALLVEILIAVLFFALAATVILDAFVSAWSLSRRSEAYNIALTRAQNLADRLYAGNLSEEILSGEGFVLSDGAWRLSEGETSMTVTLREEPRPAGVLRAAQVDAAWEEETLVSLPVSRYLPGEVE